MIDFYKYQGLGNDFIVFDGIKNQLPNVNELAKKVCNRNFGIGADGILVIENSQKAAIKMRIINADGSEAKMCGNGIRCFSKHVYEKKLVSSESFNVETLAGIIEVEVSKSDNNKVKEVRANIGKPIYGNGLLPQLDNERIFKSEIEIEGKTYLVYTLFVGCVHTIVFVEDFNHIDIDLLGPAIENHYIFPAKTNVDFCKIIDHNNIRVKTWEIGVGQTLACGTGAASAAVVCHQEHNTNKTVNVHLDGGEVKIQLKDGLVYMTGPAEFICSGKYNFQG
ncbi:diaminopimelate epimerase [Caldisalinibacter kiritimatiensis]|uniref:Diaminopimelate epimerase n=1 Tax=Caldisalinibacter kiritimatiensis TaxID=1304284 RepID=R1CRK4_9FIRM|nr:diaminopimelate epimerase [Caldisalinibacter kiritimatiensis]EOD01306.1 Diaminopimelate epimerase [Caldisalinibacter kiritimatiensis]